MSEAKKAVSALEGFVAGGIASVRESGLTGMVTLRGDLADAALARAVKSATGAKVPATRRIETGEHGMVAWMSPDELLLVVKHAQAPEIVASIEAALSGQFMLAVNVSDARVMFEIDGPGAAAREVLAKLAPVDLAPDVFLPGEIRRTRLAQVPAAFWCDDEGVFRIVAFRSVAQYVGDLLKDAAAAHASPGYF